ncbi:hypothetical protein [Erwinia sorbitola]|uniref:Uncharacterized protein n=1 Tax=Erwinia sorbitola TaxID=2681984 RepID=A0ABW9RFT6_9GAMM|nr:hypothetical protein [Erwinia sorbitola]MTD28937.1 hypothetical protein [Erwinia sorbitola]
MDARRLILTNGFTQRELLRLKTQYLSKKRIVYGRIQKVTEDESFDKFILLIAEICSRGFFGLCGISVVITILTYLEEGFFGGAVMFVICFIPVFYNFFNCARAAGLNVTIAIKLSTLRLRMRWYKISPPQIVDD